MVQSPPSASAPPVAKVRRRDAAATRERLLTAAEAQFAAHGLAGSRVDEIACAAGVNVQLIYRYFGDKAGLYQAAFDRLFARAAAAVDTAIWQMPANLAPRERFAYLVGAYVDFVWSDPAYAHMGLWNMAERNALGVAEEAMGSRALNQLTAAFVGECIAAGLFRPDTAPGMFACSLVALCLGQFGLFQTESGTSHGLDLADPGMRARLREVVTGAMLGAFAP